MPRKAMIGRFDTSVGREWEKYWRAYLSEAVKREWDAHRADDGCSRDLSCRVCDTYQVCWLAVRGLQ